ncbi:MAG TPA: hypothetical protein VGO62_07545 [Myxococcota bacterium]
MRVSVVALIAALATPALADDPPKSDAPKADAPVAPVAPVDAVKPADEVKPAEVVDKNIPPAEPPKNDGLPKPTTPPVPTAPVNASAVDCPKGTLFCFKNDVVAVWPKLRVRPGFKYVDADPQILYIGENDGFFLDEARIGAEGNVSNIVHFKLTIEAASLLPGATPNQPITALVASAADAYVGWTPSPYFVVYAGQQLMPSEYEGGDVEAAIPFTHKSVFAGGVRSGEGEEVAGLSPLRQVGLVLGSSDNLKLGDIPLEYRLGISNGNGLNQLGNDNKLPAGYLRLSSGFGDAVRVGIGGRFNPRTIGTLPNLYNEQDLVGFVDAELAIDGISAVVEAEGRQTAFTTLDPSGTNPAGSETSLGGALWIGYTVDLVRDLGFAVTPAYRLSIYDPSSSFAVDQLMENTLGVRIDGDPLHMPLSFVVDYTILTEVGDFQNNVQVRDLADNRLTALFQIEL